MKRRANCGMDEKPNILQLTLGHKPYAIFVTFIEFSAFQGSREANSLSETL